MLAESELRNILVLCCAAGLCLIALGCAPKEAETAAAKSQSGLTMTPEGLGKLDARLFYIRSKYGLSSEEAQAKMEALYEESGYTDVAWDNYRKWVEGQSGGVFQAYEKSKKTELARLRAEGFE